LPLVIAAVPAYDCASPMSRFRLTDWVVPPVIVPVFPGLLILTVAVLHG
jgi:hypothetical protein